MAEIDDFFSAQTEEQIKKKDDLMQKQSSDQKPVSISVPGKYLCEVSTFTYFDKKANKQAFSPRIFVSDSKGSLNMSISLKVVDGTPQVPKGSTIYTNIVLSPKSDKQEDIDKIMRYAKPKIALLTGTDKISFSKEWLKEWLMPEFEQKGDSWVLTKDHKMKQRVMATVDEGVNQQTSKVQYEVKFISKAGPDDKSVSVEIADDSNFSATDSNAPTDKINYADAVDTGDVPADAESIPEVSDVSDF